MNVWCQVGSKGWMTTDDDALGQVAQEVTDQGVDGYIHDEGCLTRMGADECQPYVVRAHADHDTSPDPEQYPVPGTLMVVLQMRAWYSDEATKARVTKAIHDYSPVLMGLLRTHVAQVLEGERDKAHLN